MKLRNSIAGAIVAAAALVPTLAPAPALAQTRTFTDTVDQPGGYDQISRVKVTYGPRALTIRIVSGADGSFSDHFHVYLDTAGHGYPEWFVGTYAEVERWGMSRANKWASDESAAPLGRPGCSGDAHYAFSATPATVWISIPNRCIGRPPRVRVNVESVFETGTVFDRLPTRYHWTPWVRRG
ncbi:MAG TPA: hypothetical protein VN088_11055 [Nocardioides sp.]|nr:hypothetical protein [Nocardioides sp.]